MSELGSGDPFVASWSSEGGAWSILVHGGAGPATTDVRQRRGAIAGCLAAARAAGVLLRAGGSALDAVERAVMLLEDDPTFNAGTGACLNEAGVIELDAGIMEGSRLRAGGVCALPPFQHPIAIARAVLEDGGHVLYAAEGAARFAEERGFARVTPEALTTVAARESWARVKAGRTPGGQAPGTVGSVARDTKGVVAAATSTGGRVNKRVGRVGDSPIAGAGTYADDDAGACSATGDGEAVLRVCLARSAIDLMRQRAHPEDAARTVIRTMAARVGGSGGVILVDRLGRLGWARNTASMAWASAADALPETEAGA